MYINGDGFGGQIAERFPIPSSQNLVAFLDRKFPLIERHAWRRPSRQDWKISRDVLARRQLCICGTAPTGKPLEVIAIFFSPYCIKPSCPADYGNAMSSA